MSNSSGVQRGMTEDQLRSLLNTQTDDEFVDRALLSGRPWIFSTDEIYHTWQQSVSAELALQPENVRIVGSAATGFSLSPLKPGRSFQSVTTRGRASDIDVALIDQGLFADAWNLILVTDRRRLLGGTGEARSKIREDIYWGVVGQKSVPSNTIIARRLLTAMSAAGRLPPLRGYQIRCRVYRRIDDLRAYHVSSLRQLRAELSTR